MNDIPRNKRTHMHRPTPKPIDVKYMTREASRDVFSQKLQAAMDAKGWNQSDLARAATVALGGEGVIQRDNISKYINGKAIPSSPKLHAISTALGVTKDELIPGVSVMQPTVRNAPIGVDDLGDGKAWLRVNQPVSWDVALKILDMLKGDKDE